MPESLSSSLLGQWNMIGQFTIFFSLFRDRQTEFFVFHKHTYMSYVLEFQLHTVIT